MTERQVDIAETLVDEADALDSDLEFDENGDPVESAKSVPPPAPDEE